MADGFTAPITIAALKISRRPSDDSHPCGHGKVEFLASAFISIALLLLAVGIMGRAIFALSVGNVSAPSFLAIGPAVVSILTNIAIPGYGLGVGRELNNPVICANAKKNRADAFSSLASLVGIIGALLSYPFLDSLAAIVVAVLIGHMGYGIFREATDGLMDSAMSKSYTARMRRLSRSVPGVREAGFVRARRIGQKTWADVGI